MGQERRWTRLEGVDGLRVLAICLVLMNYIHLRLLFAKIPYTAGLPRQLVSSLVWKGQYGRAIPALFLAVIVCSTVVGEIIARSYSEPMNHWLRGRWGTGSKR